MLPGEQSAFRWLNGLAGRWEWMDAALRFVMSDYLIPVGATLTVAWLWFAGRNGRQTGRYQHAVLRGLLALGITQLVVALINIAVGRPRPFQALGNVTVLFYEPINSSFPAHPVATVVAVGIAVWTVRRGLGWMVIGLGVLLGIARIIGGLWFPTDVLGGIVIGWLCALAAEAILRAVPRAEDTVRRVARRLQLD